MLREVKSKKSQILVHDKIKQLSQDSSHHYFSVLSSAAADPSVNKRVTQQDPDINWFKYPVDHLS